MKENLDSNSHTIVEGNDQIPIYVGHIHTILWDGKHCWL